MRRSIIVCCVIVSMFCVLGCGYGHAAISSDLLVSGEAKIANTANTGDPFGEGSMQEFTVEMCNKIELGAEES